MLNLIVSLCYSAHTQRINQSGPELRQLCTLNHLESQVQSCLCIGTPGEYKFWLQTYVRYLVQEGKFGWGKTVLCGVSIYTEILGSLICHWSVHLFVMLWLEAKIREMPTTDWKLQYTISNLDMGNLKFPRENVWQCAQQSGMEEICKARETTLSQITIG